MGNSGYRSVTLDRRANPSRGGWLLKDAENPRLQRGNSDGNNAEQSRRMISFSA